MQGLQEVLTIFCSCQCEKLRIGHDSRGPGKGIFVEEVEVTPAGEAHVIFPCSCWLAEDKDDGRLERDVLPGQPKPPRPSECRGA